LDSFLICCLTKELVLSLFLSVDQPLTVGANELPLDSDFAVQLLDRISESEEEARKSGGRRSHRHNGIQAASSGAQSPGVTTHAAPIQQEYIHVDSLVDEANTFKFQSSPLSVGGGALQLNLTIDSDDAMPG
jgi:hypothetical protein